MAKHSDFKKALKTFKKIAICSHDAGGAEVLSEITKSIKKNYSFTLLGPAKKIYSRKIGNYNISSFKKAIDNSEVLLTSTSIRSSLELKAISYAKKKQIRSISILDHWSGYLQRFIFCNKKILPDEIWTLDKEAFKKAKKIFPDLKLRLFENPYLSKIKISQSRKFNKKILYLSDNCDDFFKKKGLDYYLFSKFLDNINKYLKNYDRCIYIKPHPSEKKNKFKKYKSIKHKFKILNHSDLINIISKFNIVVGHQSMGLVVGKIAGLNTVNIKTNMNETIHIPKKYIDISF